MAIDQDRPTQTDGQVAEQDITSSGDGPAQRSPAERGRRAGRIIRRAAITAAVALAAGAVVKELRTPKDDRTWNGRIAKVPYDFRRPSLRRMKDAMWNPSDDRLFTPRPFGLGWTLNLAKAKTLASNAAASRRLPEKIDLDEARELAASAKGRAVETASRLLQRAKRALDTAA